VFRAGDSGFTQATVVASNTRQEAGVNYYIANGFATDYTQQGGSNIWYTAPSGTAGNAISFTQAMTLSSDGTFRVKGAGTAGSTDAFQVSGSAPASAMALNSSGGLQCVNSISVGNATPTTSGAGITFPATQSASSDANTLDDYEEGTWTPSVGGTATYTAQAGRYTKIGNIVYIQGQINILLLLTGSASTLSGLPFTAASSTSEGGFNVTFFSGFAVNVIQPVLGVDASSTNCTVYSRTTAGTSSSAVSVFGDGARLFFYGHYQVA
jgi:hypothetical protein